MCEYLKKYFWIFFFYTKCVEYFLLILNCAESQKSLAIIALSEFVCA